MATMMDELFDANDDARKHAEEADRLRAVNAELLAALRGLMKGYERRLGDWENANFNKEWNVAKAAIANAEELTRG